MGLNPFCQHDLAFHVLGAADFVFPVNAMFIEIRL